MCAGVRDVGGRDVETRAGVEAVAPRAVGLLLFARVNNSGADECRVALRPERCCLDSGDARCDVVQVLGTAADTIPGGTTRTLHLVAPLLDPYERRGYCSVFVDYEYPARPRHAVRDAVRIHFDTTLRRGAACGQPDQDPLRDCRPVHCDTHYNGRRPYYSHAKKRCVEVPACLASADSELPSRAYDPVSNTCVDKPAISADDINFIKALTGGKSRRTKDILIIRTSDKNCSKSAKNSAPADYDPDTVTKVVGVKPTTHASRTPHAPHTSHTPRTPDAPPASSLTCLLAYVTCRRHTLLALGGVILLQCCLICALLYCFTRKCVCCKKKEVVRKFFNYRQDASATTPLIGTSNMDTDTTDFQYLSESSNYIDKKIRCYKACQRERKTSAKLSMSDDILSKCVARRDWRRLPRAETIPEARRDEARAAERRELALEKRKPTDVKVNFQDEARETAVAKPVSVKSIVKQTEEKRRASLSDSSERVIRCHSYEYERSAQALAGARAHGSVARGAQACFSNDSMDDFLSERGVLFLGDNASKYSLSSASSAGRSARSSRTSKQRGVLPPARGRGPASDPGAHHSAAELDLQLLHLSRASVCSSSNDSDICKDLKRTKDSTSSL
ncbi:hypothetical protein PYW07_011245 [Mythimna separata]|uniref:Uncharacterized protein n=1 Tax=Mythimna separata TaxID=271217 RepID=A0AAD7Y979_MYTSE|nr:hypothetical protein PYW07_011245 [Mythimna separata]